MQTSKISDWLTVLSNIGVIGGIIFLAVEIRQNNESLAAQERYNRYVVATESGYTLLNNPEVMMAVWGSRGDIRSFEEISYQLYTSQLFTGMEWTFYELPRDELPIERWRRIFTANEAESLWELEKSRYGEEFVAFIESTYF